MENPEATEGAAINRVSLLPRIKDALTKLTVEEGEERLAEIEEDGGDDILLGSASNDIILGMGGDDYIDGKGDFDCIYAGSGNDIVVFDPSDYRVSGGSGIDTLLVRSGDTSLDTILARTGRYTTSSFELLLKGEGKVTSQKDLAELGIIIEGDHLTLSEAWTQVEGKDGLFVFESEGWHLETILPAEKITHLTGISLLSDGPEGNLDNLLGESEAVAPQTSQVLENTFFDNNDLEVNYSHLFEPYGHRTEVRASAST